MPNLVVHSSQELSENADNTIDGGDNETHLTIIKETVPMSKLISVRGSLSRTTTVRNYITCVKKKKRVSYNKEARVKIRRDNDFQILISDLQKEDAKEYDGSRNFYVEIMLGNSKQGYNTKFDDFPSENKVAHGRHRNMIDEVEEGII